MDNKNLEETAVIGRLRKNLLLMWAINIPLLILYFLNSNSAPDNPITSTIAFLFKIMPILWVLMLAFTAYVELIVIPSLKSKDKS